MDKALANILRLLGAQALQAQRMYFERIHKLPGANRVFKRIASTSDKEQLEDYLVEVRYALVFIGLGFQVVFEPLGSTGPDLRISRDGRQVVVEIMRFRKVSPGPPVLDLLDENLILPEYGNPPRDIQKAFDKIMKKFSQIGNEQGIIAIWNDDGDPEEGETDTAVRNLRSDASRGIRSLPNGLFSVVHESTTSCRQRSEGGEPSNNSTA